MSNAPDQALDKTNPEYAAERLASLLELPLGRLVKSDVEYNKAYEKRIERFKLLASNSRHPDALLKCSEMTEASHKIADELRTAISEILAIAALSGEEKLLRIFAMFDRAKTPSALDAVSPDVRPEAAEVVRKTTLMAREFLLDVERHPPPAESTATYNEGIQEKFRGEDDTTLLGIKMQVHISLQAIKSLELRVNILGSFACLAILYRALLYSGIIEREGGSLKRGTLKAKGVESVEEIMSAAFGEIPGVGLAISLINGVRIWVTDSEAELVKKRDLIEDYLQGYSEILALWQTAANALANSISSSLKSI